MAEHTPAPWTVVLRGERGTFHIPEAQKHEAKHTGDGVDGYTISSANARLIAAAPDLLVALLALERQALQSDVNKPSNEWGREALDMTRAAIAKATGQDERQGEI